MEKDILERKVFHAGKTLFATDEAHSNAYLIQKGEVRSYTLDHNSEVEVARFGEGDIVGEANLLIDNPSALTYEAVSDTTVVVIVRQDFEKKLSHIDPSMLNIIITLIQKLKTYEHQSMEHALEENKIHAKAFEIVEHLLRDMNKDRKARYREIMQPHFNVMCHALENLKIQEMQERQSSADIAANAEMAANVEAGAISESVN